LVRRRAAGASNLIEEGLWRCPIETSLIHMRTPSADARSVTARPHHL
jgi:hypothetical protein